MAPKDVHDLIPRTFEYVTYYGKRDFAEVIKGHELERWSWIKLFGSMWSQGLYKRVAGVSVRKDKVTMEAEVRGGEIWRWCMAGFEGARVQGM